MRTTKTNKSTYRTYFNGYIFEISKMYEGSDWMVSEVFKNGYNLEYLEWLNTFSTKKGCIEWIKRVYKI